MIEFKDFYLNDYKDCLIVTDGKLSELYGIVGDNVYLLPQGESAKSFFYAEKLCEWFLSKNWDKRQTVAAVGGGSIGDAVGFAASIYKRGINLIHVPTTLLSQIDSSIGGKTAIDLCGVKNAVGTYKSADTYIDVNFLNTLNAEQLLNGRGEVLKYKMLSLVVDAADENDTLQLVKACVNYKSKICEVDPFDTGIRNRLNFGHTVGHAMELYFGLSHGVAVANGILYETAMAYRLGLCSEEYAVKWTGAVKRDFPVYALNKEVLQYMINDKKNSGNKICFVLPNKFDNVYLDIEKAAELLIND